MEKITLISPIKIKGYKVIIVDFRHKTITDLLNELTEIKSKILAGYSISGTLALILAQRLDLDKLILYSPSPFFKERINTMPKYILNKLGKKRLNDIKNYSVKDFNVEVKTEIHIGGNEVKDMMLFAKYLNKKLKNSSLIVKEGCGHSDLLI